MTVKFVTCDTSEDKLLFRDEIGIRIFFAFCVVRLDVLFVFFLTRRAFPYQNQSVS